MGGSQSTSGDSDSTRTITLETEEGEVDVKLTEDFISHVTKGGGQSTSLSEDSTGAGVDDPLPSTGIPSVEEILIPAYGPPDGSTPSFSGGKWRKLYEEERQKNEEFNRISREEFDKAANEVKKDFRQSEIGKLVPLCEENRQEVLECYRDNPDKTLLCSDIVNQYVQCVRQSRKSLLVQTLNSNNKNNGD